MKPFSSTFDSVDWLSTFEYINFCLEESRSHNSVIDFSILNINNYIYTSAALL